jgi:hypothetical protein
MWVAGGVDERMVESSNNLSSMKTGKGWNRSIRLPADKKAT